MYFTYENPSYNTLHFNKISKKTFNWFIIIDKIIKIR